jgi:hypothetical protein
VLQTEALRQRRRLGILHGPVWGSGICCGPGLFPCILLPPDPRSGALPNLCSGTLPHLCSRISHVLEVSVPSHGSDLFRVILRNLCLGIPCLGILHSRCLGILYGLHGPDLYRRILYRLHDLCPRIFLGRPSLELLQRSLSRWQADFGLTLVASFKSGSNFVARRRVRCSRQQSLSAGG